MFNDVLTIFDDPSQGIVQDRLARAATALRALSLSTLEEYRVAIYSAINQVLALGNTDMTPLVAVGAEGPAVVGDIQTNAQNLNNDAVDIAAQIGRVEATAAEMYNLAAATQNALRQQIREAVYAPNNFRYLEGFVNANNLDPSSTASVDFNAGSASLPVLQSSQLTPTYAIGANSYGTAIVGVEALSSPTTGSAMQWSGSQLELIVSFPSPQIVNRLQVDSDDYASVVITGISSTPDGNVYDDILAELGSGSVILNGVVGKLTGSALLDFSPRYVSKMRILFVDPTGADAINLRDVNLVQQSFTSTAQVTTQPITTLSPQVVFQAATAEAPPYTSVTHQVSTDGVHFTNVVPGATVNVPSGKLWYRASLNRSEQSFTAQAAALATTSLDPTKTSGYQIASSSYVPKGNGVAERTLTLTNVTGPITFRDVPLPGTLSVQAGSVLLGAGDYAFNNGVLSFATTQASVIVSYQMSALGTSALVERKKYFTPRVTSVSFQKA